MVKLLIKWEVPDDDDDDDDDENAFMQPNWSRRVGY